MASAAGLIFLLGLHSPTLGCDVVGAYVPAFEMVGTDFINSPNDSIFGFELGFMNYMVLIHHVTDNVQVYLFISALIIIIPIIHLIYKESEDIMFSILIYTSWYTYYFSFSGLRQAIAIGLCAVATIFLLKRQLIMFVLFVMLSSQIHASALLFAVAYPLYWYRFSNKRTMLVGIIAVILLVSSKSFIQLIAIVLFGADSGYAHRLETSEFSGFTMAVMYFVFVLYQVNCDKEDKNPYIPILMLISILQFGGIYSSVMPRLTYYYMPLFTLSFAYTVEKQTSKLNRTLVRGGLVVMFVSFFFMQANSHYLSVTPFKFFWE